jgi:SnoaL-like polyketide cyclase
VGETDNGLPRSATGPYPSVPEFIYGITREIWEDRGVAKKLESYYAADVLVRSPANLIVGRDTVTAQTLQTMHQFPDRQLVGEDVIWAPDGHGGFLSSHRLISVMRHSGAGPSGVATHQIVRSRVIADCWVQEAQVKEEWLVRDQAAFANCIGSTASALARQMADREIASGQPISYFEPNRDRPSRYVPRISDDAAVTHYLRSLERIWQGKDTSAIRDLYFHGATLHIPGGDAVHGHADIDRFVVGYLASFPDAQLTVHSAVLNREPELPLRIATRWSLTGTHSGFGHFGEPTGAPVYVMGISHAYVSAGHVRWEWLLTDEVSIWKQIYAHRGGPAAP